MITKKHPMGEPMPPIVDLPEEPPFTEVIAVRTGVPSKMIADDYRTNLFIDPDATTSGVRAIRSQADNQQEYWSDMSGTVNTEESMTKPELAPETDINYMMSRMGLNMQGRPIDYGKELDQNLDLQQALHAVADARTAWANQPAELKKHYPTWESMLNAAQNGEYAHRVAEMEEKKARAKEKAAADAAANTTPQPSPKEDKG